MEASAPPWSEPVRQAWTAGIRLSAVSAGTVDTQFEHSRLLATALQEHGRGRCLDLGTGVGVPGLALAGWWPETDWTLVDAARRRLPPVRRAVEDLGWTGRVTVVHGRAECLGRDPDHRETYDLVVARLFGPPAVVAECASPLLRVGGVLAVTEPVGDAGRRWTAVADADLGLVPRPAIAEPIAVQVLDKRQPCPERFPRRPGVPARRPLFP